MRKYDIITKKKRGDELSREEIFKFIEEYTKDNIPDYQAAALLMAIYFCGMTEREISQLTQAMALSGDSVDLSELGNLSVDKQLGIKPRSLLRLLQRCLGARSQKCRDVDSGIRAVQQISLSRSQDTKSQFLPKSLFVKLRR